LLRQPLSIKKSYAGAIHWLLLSALLLVFRTTNPPPPPTLPPPPRTILQNCWHNFLHIQYVQYCVLVARHRHSLGIVIRH
jgi:hypothetical protein